jgi:hypothetical protein
LGDIEAWGLPIYATLATGIIGLLINRRAWVHRRVETIEFLDDTWVRRRVSVDFTVPKSSTYQNAMSPLAPGFAMLPIHLLRKRLLRNFDMRDHDGAALPILTKEQNQLLGDALVMSQVMRVSREQNLPAVTPATSQLKELIDLVHEGSAENARSTRQALFERYAAAGTANALSVALSGDTVVVPLMKELASDFHLCVTIRADPAERRVVKFSYAELVGPVAHVRGPIGYTGGFGPAARPFVGTSPPIGARELGTAVTGFIRKLGDLLGWGPMVIATETMVGTAESTHIEVPAPEESFIEKASLVLLSDDGTEGEEIARDGPTQRLHMQVSSIAQPAYCKLRLSVRLRARGPVVAALFTTAGTAVLLSGGLAVRWVWNTQLVGETPALVLLAIPGIYAAYLFGPGQHQLVRKLFVGLRLVSRHRNS